MLRVLDLFSGIGGFSLGLERTNGFKTVAFCEIEPFCRKVLAKHWPDVPCYHDVRELTSERLRADGISVDVICGGFPCQDVSLAGRRGGLEAERSGLWREYHRLIRELRPRYAIVENTPGLLSLGMARVLGDMAAIRYDAVWECIPAAAVGADHIRDRIWIIAHPADGEYQLDGRPIEPSQEMAEDVADTVFPRFQGRRDAGSNTGHATRVRERIGLALSTPIDFPREYEFLQPVMGRGIHGVPDRAHRIKALGNAVVPQIPELIGRAILESITENGASP